MSSSKRTLLLLDMTRLLLTDEYSVRTFVMDFMFAMHITTMSRKSSLCVGLVVVRAIATADWAFTTFSMSSLTSSCMGALFGAFSNV